MIVWAEERVETQFDDVIVKSLPVSTTDFWVFFFQKIVDHIRTASKQLSACTWTAVSDVPRSMIPIQCFISFPMWWVLEQHPILWQMGDPLYI